MDLLIIGAGGFAREVAKLVEDINRDSYKYKQLGFVDIEVGTCECDPKDLFLEGDSGNEAIKTKIYSGMKSKRHMADLLALK